MSSHTHVLVYLSDVLHFSFVQRGRRLTLREMAFCQDIGHWDDNLESKCTFYKFVPSQHLHKRFKSWAKMFFHWVISLSSLYLKWHKLCFSLVIRTLTLSGWKRSDCLASGRQTRASAVTQICSWLLADDLSKQVHAGKMLRRADSTAYTPFLSCCCVRTPVEDYSPRTIKWERGLKRHRQSRREWDGRKERKGIVSASIF